MPLEALALLLDLVGLGAPVWWLAGEALSLLVRLAHRVADAPGAVALLPAMPRGAYALIVAGGLWIALWRKSWRRWGLAAVAAGALWALVIPAPDLIVTGDGRHLVLRLPSGELALLRPRAGDYVRETLAELAGAEPDYRDLERLPTAACSPDLCVADLDAGGRRWRILATRTPNLVAWEEMRRACAEADIIVADRRLPRGCVPRWLKADRAMLRPHRRPLDHPRPPPARRDRRGAGRPPSLGAVAFRSAQSPWTQASSFPAGSVNWKRRPPGKAKIGRTIAPPAASTAASAASKSSTSITASGARVASAASPCRPISVSPVSVAA